MLNGVLSRTAVLIFPGRIQEGMRQSKFSTMVNRPHVLTWHFERSFFFSFDDVRWTQPPNTFTQEVRYEMRSSDPNDGFHAVYLAELGNGAHDLGHYLISNRVVVAPINA